MNIFIQTGLVLSICLAVTQASGYGLLGGTDGIYSSSSLYGSGYSGYRPNTYYGGGSGLGYGSGTYRPLIGGGYGYNGYYQSYNPSYSSWYRPGGSPYYGGSGLGTGYYGSGYGSGLNGYYGNNGLDGGYYSGYRPSTYDFGSGTNYLGLNRPLYSSGGYSSSYYKK